MGLVRKGFIRIQSEDITAGDTLWDGRNVLQVEADSDPIEVVLVDGEAIQVGRGKPVKVQRRGGEPERSGKGADDPRVR